MKQPAFILFSCLLVPFASSAGRAQSLERELQAVGAAQLAAEARKLGDARRGAVVFYQRALACRRCHAADDADRRLGPDLSALGKDVSDEHLVESVLWPSKVVREGYDCVVVETGDDQITGFLVSDSEGEVVLRDAARDYKEVRFKKSELDDYYKSTASAMPAGLVNSLSSTQQFVDLVRYLIEIRDGGGERARALEPDPSLYADRPLPAYENDIDHRGFIRGLDTAAFARGKAIYERLCINCHGTRDQPGSLPTSLDFSSGTFKNGSDPYAIYQTLTRGFGMMNAQTWMVPSQKYDVTHYIREAYLKRYNPSQYFVVDETYLARLPAGKSRGPAPSSLAPWEQMDYGPSQILTLEIGEDGKNFAYKGNAIRLDAGPGGVAQGRYWIVFDTDTMRVAAAWRGKGFIDWNCVHFNGKHAVHPRLVGDVQLANPTGPGWGRPRDGSFDDTRLVGRDGRRYGPLPRAWARYEGMYSHGPDTILAYSVGTASVLEMPAVQVAAPGPIFRRVLNVGPRSEDLVLQVAHCREAAAKLETVAGVAVFGTPWRPARESVAGDVSKMRGATRLEVKNTEGLHAGDGDFTLAARIKTKEDGTILAQTGPSLDWLRDGLSWFVRGGRLTLDIGWVGAFRGKRKVADGRWHDVAVTYRAATGKIRFFVDGKPEAHTGTLRRKKPLARPVVRIGFTSRKFPGKSYFKGQLPEVRFYNAVLSEDEIRRITASQPAATQHLAAHWDLTAVDGKRVADRTHGKHDALVERGEVETRGWAKGFTVAGFEGDVDGLRWRADGCDLRLEIPSGGDVRRFTVWFASADDRKAVRAVRDAVVIDDPRQDLRKKTKGGPARWPHVLTTKATIGVDDGPFAIDVLRRPTDNPWFCRLRLTGIDFTPDGDSAIVSSWDGSIWRVSGLAALPAAHAPTARSVPLRWRRIASGLFQPLGVKVVRGRIHVTCRDQLCVLHDLNDDQEIDWFECFNSDHQVTDHFHEFAMGLQTDVDGNFYYAKSARHALPALVPHHGTLLRVSKDGSRTDIIANGFRAANGVCVNPDGTFVVTDQEGHWNPKNRINWVKPGGFYGNMYGYHDVTDTSDAAMEQPLVWITNSFDRSPGELLWVDSERWGPLQGSLLNLSYGYGMVYIVPHEEVAGSHQGGMCALPIKRFPTGVMRGRFHPRDRQLYLAGMFAWAGSQTQPGGLYRLRCTGKPVYLPVGLAATTKGISIEFSGALDRRSASDPSSYQVKVWGLKRTKNYGSKHYNERKLALASASLDADGRTVHLDLPGIAPTWCMEIRYELRSALGSVIRGRIHNTVHKLRPR